MRLIILINSNISQKANFKNFVNKIGFRLILVVLVKSEETVFMYVFELNILIKKFKKCRHCLQDLLKSA